MKLILFLFLGAILFFLAAMVIGRAINARIYKIRPEAGVQKSEYVTIGGIGQYIQAHGQDRSNPVIVVLHGGPGGNMAYYSYAWQAALEQRYTIVHWDQRGCGNTYYRDQGAEKPTLERLLSDLDELVDDLRAAYGKEDVIILGHSWGTFLGGIYSGAHPEKVRAYLSVSQMVDFKRSEQASAQEAIRLAQAAGRERDARKIGEQLPSIMALQRLERPEAGLFLKFRQRKEKCLPAQYGGHMLSLRLFSPYMTWGDFKWMFSFDKLLRSNSRLYELLLSDGRCSMYDYPTQYRVPVIMVAGDRDWTTPRGMAYDYFQAISAPQKEWITIQDAGHIPFVD